MANPKEPTPEQPIYDAPGESEQSGPHGGTGAPGKSEDAPGQVKKQGDENVDQPPEPNQDLPQ